MSASVVELILARVQAVLLNATAAGAKVEREREDAYGEDDTEAINIVRGDSNTEPIGDSGDRVFVEWGIEHYTRATTGLAAEQAADALHMEAHALLAADSILASKGRGFRCMGTSIVFESADSYTARLAARYRMQVFVRPDDLTKAI